MNDVKYWTVLDKVRENMEEWNERRKMAEQNAKDLEAIKKKNESK